MVISTVKGHFEKFVADVDFDPEYPERSRVEASVEAASLVTRDAQRDAHLRSPDFLDAEHFPIITFKSRRIARYANGKYGVAGDLTMRGVTREVVLDTELAGITIDPWGNRRAGFRAETAINREDWGLTWNMALEAGGLVVGDTVKIAIEAELVAPKA
jgi:polyisoprenoid-binding protein YceI